VSQAFLNSELIEKYEMSRIVDRAKLGQMIIVPVLVEPCDWSEYPVLADRQMVPGAMPLIDFTESDPKWAKVKSEILDGLKTQIKRIRAAQALVESQRRKDLARENAGREADERRRAEEQAQLEAKHARLATVPAVEAQPVEPVSIPEETKVRWEPTPLQVGQAARVILEPIPEVPDAQPPPPETPEPEPASRTMPVWGWVALVALAALPVFGAVRLFQPSSQPQPPQQALTQAASSPDTNPNAATPAAVPQGAGPAEGSKQSVQKPDFAAMSRQADALYDQKQYAQAAPLYDRACDGGDAAGCGNLGLLYANGMGVAQNYAQAAALLSKACDGGYAGGCVNLGFLYENGSGVAQNYSQAAAAYSKACDGGDARGCSFLGDLFRLGHGAAKDLEKATQLLTKGCNMGNQFGCDRLKQIH
jgi:hypothetical protein